MYELTDGSRGSNCLRPCLSTKVVFVLQIQNENSPFLLKISGVKVHDGLDDDDFTQIALAFDQTVTVSHGVILPQTLHDQDNI